MLTFQNIRALTSLKEIKSLTVTTHKPNNGYTKLNERLVKETSEGNKVTILCDYRRAEAFHIDSFYFMYPQILDYYKNSAEEKVIVETSKSGDIILLCDKKELDNSDFYVEKLEIDDKLFTLNRKI